MSSTVPGQSATVPNNTASKTGIAKYGSMILILCASYGVILACLLGLAAWLGHSLEQVLDAVILATLFYFLAAMLITVVARPARQPSIKFKPIHLSIAALVAGSFLLLMLLIQRQPSDEGKLQVVLVVSLLAFIIIMLAWSLAAWFASRPKKPNLDLPAFVIAVVGTMIAALAVPALLRPDDPPIQLRISALIVVLGYVLLFALIILSVINTPSTKPAPIPDGHAGIVRVKGRIQRIGFDKSMDVKLKGEEFKVEDVRLRTEPITVPDCMTADHVPVDVQAAMDWRPCNTEEGLRTFYTSFIDPQDALQTQFKASILCEIGLRNSQFISGREDQIAGNVKQRMAAVAHQYGVQVMKVAITQARMKHPTLDQGISPLTEASRLQQMDSAVRSASMATVQHAEAMSNAQAAASAAGRDARDQATGKYGP